MEKFYAQDGHDSFAPQWQYLSQWSLCEAQVLLIENVHDGVRVEKLETPNFPMFGV